MIYAKQVEPKYQESHVDFAYEELVGISIYGNHKLPSYRSDDFKFVIDLMNDYWIYDAFSTMDEDELLRYFNKEFTGYRRNKPYSIEEIRELKNCMYYNCDICKTASIILDGDWDVVTIHGSSQSEWNKLYYDKSLPIDKRMIEKDYFNTGSEFIISDNENFDDPYYMYCYGDTNDEIRKEIADDNHCDPSEIKMFVFNGYTEPVPIYKEV